MGLKRDPKSIEGKIFETNNCGSLIVIRYSSFNLIKVKFIETGAVVDVQNIAHIKNGCVRDPLCKTVLDIGFHGVGRHKGFIGKKRTSCYTRWIGILSRCYNKLGDSYGRYGGVGVVVHEDWHNFQNFADWYYLECKKLNIDPDDNDMQIDKDIKSVGIKMYSPDNCILISSQSNSEYSNAKTWTVISPDGELIEIYNLEKFCNENNLAHSSMAKVSRGLQKSHRGYKCQIKK